MPGQPQPQAPQGPQGGPQQGPDQGGQADQAVQMIQQGYAILGKMIEGAKGQLPPEDIQLFQAAAKATDAFLQALTSPAQGQGGPQQRPAPGGPMPANANAGAKQVGPQG